MERGHREQGCGFVAGETCDLLRLPTAQRIEALKALVKNLGGKLPETLPPLATPQNASRAEVNAARDAALVDALTAAARARMSVPDGALDDLARKRADAIQHAPVTDTALRRHVSSQRRMAR